MPLSLYLFSSQHNVGRHETRGNGKQLHGMAEKFHNLACNLVFNTFLRLQPQHRFGGVLHLHVLEGNEPRIARSREGIMELMLWAS